MGYSIMSFFISFFPSERDAELSGLVNPYRIDMFDIIPIYFESHDAFVARALF